MNRLSRSTAIKIAAILSLLLGVLGGFVALSYLARGAAELDQDVAMPPYAVIVSVFAFAFLRFVSAYGAWIKQRWGIVVMLLTNALDGTLALPDILFAPTMGWQIASTISIVVSVAIILLCLWRDRRPAVA